MYYYVVNNNFFFVSIEIIIIRRCIIVNATLQHTSHHNAYPDNYCFVQFESYIYNYYYL